MDNSQSRIQSVLGEKYEIRDLIQSGGMGKIFLGIHKALGKKVAIKIVHQELVSNEQIKSRFHREAKLAAGLDHPGIIDIYDFGTSDDFDYIIMPFIEGETLQARIQKQGPMEVSEAVAFMMEITEALHHAHTHHVIHRDIKPSNIMIDGNNRTVIADFGISKDLGDSDLTAPNAVLGSPRYMSPEQIRGDAVDARSDLYSLGLVFYEMMTGIHPFKGKNSTAIYYSQAHEIPPRPEVSRPDIPRELGAIIMKLLEKEPDKRYANGADVLKALRDFKEGKTRPPVDDDATIIDDDATILDNDATILDDVTHAGGPSSAGFQTRVADRTVAGTGAATGPGGPSPAPSFYQANKKRILLACLAGVLIVLAFLVMTPGRSKNPAITQEPPKQEQPSIALQRPVPPPSSTPQPQPQTAAIPQQPVPASTATPAPQVQQPQPAQPQTPGYTPPQVAQPQTPAYTPLQVQQPQAVQQPAQYPPSTPAPAAPSPTPQRMASVSPDLTQQGPARPGSSAGSRSLLDEFAALGNQTPADFSLWTNKETFHIGDVISYTFKSGSPCYAVILGYTTQGELVQMFPNHFSASAFIQPGKEYSIPDDSMGFDFNVTGPAGQDTIIALISSTPIQLFGDPSETNPFPSVSQSDPKGISDILDGITKLRHRTIQQLRVMYTILD
ncbi:MAG: serine/threonine-protein kinase [Pseudomonadota bacterium]